MFQMKFGHNANNVRIIMTPSITHEIHFTMNVSYPAANGKVLITYLAF
jgi:hypothetical protein